MNGLIFVLLAISVSIKGQEWTVGTTIRYPNDATDIGESAFNALFRASPPFIIRRECPSCQDAHQKVIYYKRITPDNTWNAYKNMRSDWFSENNILNTNFILANDLDAAIAGTNQFATCNYDDPGIGSFRDCGRNGLIGGQWTSSVGRGGHAARFSIYTPYLCVNVDCNDNNLCTDDSCDPVSGKCIHSEVICDDNDACTTDTCDKLTGCGTTDITCKDDGNVCNGDEGCSEGICISDGNAPECEDWQVCEPGRGCICNCHEFDIDGFLLDCSDEFQQNEEQLDIIDSRLDGLVIEDGNHDTRLNDLEGRCDLVEPEVDTLASYVGSPSDGSDPQESLFQLYEELRADFEELKSRIHDCEEENVALK